MESPTLPSQYIFRTSPIVRFSGSNRARARPETLKLLEDVKKSKYLPRLCLDTAHVGLRQHGGVGDSDGVIIVDHGSRRKESNLMLNEFVTMFKDKTKYPIVEPAHMELAKPSISDAFSLCVKKGASRIIVSPFFLFPGRHWSQDIPSLAAAAAKEHPGVPYVVTAPLGLHELLVVGQYPFAFAVKLEFLLISYFLYHTSRPTSISQYGTKAIDFQFDKPTTVIKVFQNHILIDD